MFGIQRAVHPTITTNLFDYEPTPDRWLDQRGLYQQVWHRLIASFGIDDDVIDALYEVLESHYITPERHYHNLNHIHEVLQVVRSMQHLSHNYRPIQLAAWFHDIIYEMDAGADNEARSAEFARYYLRDVGIPKVVVEQVERLILWTRHKELPTDIDGKIIVDADLASLAAPLPIFTRNSQGIRKEYSKIPDGSYCQARVEILKQFLNRERIFLTEWMYHRYEKQARINISNEIVILQRFGR